MLRTDREIDKDLAQPKLGSERLEQATREFARDLAKRNATQETGGQKAVDEQLRRIADATAGIQAVASQSRALNDDQTAQVEEAANAIQARDPSKLDEPIEQMRDELGRLESSRADATSDVERMASDWQAVALGTALRAAEVVREALSNPEGARNAVDDGPRQELAPEDAEVSDRMRERAEAARTLYGSTATDSVVQRPPSQASAAAKEMARLADEVGAAQSRFEQADRSSLSDDQRALIGDVSNAVKVEDQTKLAASVRAIDEERDVIAMRMEAASRPLSDDATTQEAVVWKVAQQGLEESKRQLETLTAARDFAESTRNALAEETQLAEKAFADAMRHDFAKTSAVEKVWNEARSGQPSDGKGFDAARNKFWKQINEGTSREARAVGTMLKAAGYELDKGTRAPRLEERWKKLDGETLAILMEKNPEAAERLRAMDAKITEMRSQNLSTADRRLSIDHLDPQSKTKALTLEGSNLRFMSSRDNSFRGARFGHNDMPAARVLDAVKQSQRQGMSVAEAEKHRADEAQNTQKLRDKEELEKLMELERARRKSPKQE